MNLTIVWRLTVVTPNEQSRQFGHYANRLRLQFGLDQPH